MPAVGYTGLAEPMPIADISEQLEDSAERQLPKLAECEECSGLNVEEVIVHGDAAAEIVRVAVGTGSRFDCDFFARHAPDWAE